MGIIHPQTEFGSAFRNIWSSGFFTYFITPPYFSMGSLLPWIIFFSPIILVGILIFLWQNRKSAKPKPIEDERWINGSVNGEILGGIGALNLLGGILSRGQAERMREWTAVMKIKREKLTLSIDYMIYLEKNIDIPKNEISEINVGHQSIQLKILNPGLPPTVFFYPTTGKVLELAVNSFNEYGYAYNTRTLEIEHQSPETIEGRTTLLGWFVGLMVSGVISLVFTGIIYNIPDDFETILKQPFFYVLTIAIFFYFYWEDKKGKKKMQETYPKVRIGVNL